MRALLPLALLPLPLPVVAQDFPVTVTDDAGREVTLEAAPERVVVIYNEALGQLAPLGLRPVGGLVGGGAPAVAERWLPPGPPITAVRGDDEVDLEAVAALEPDLIVANAGSNPGLAAIAPVYEASVAQDVNALADDLRTLGRLMGREREAEAAIAGTEARIAAYAALAGPDRANALPVANAGDGSFYVFPPSNLACAVLAAASRANA